MSVSLPEPGCPRRRTARASGLTIHYPLNSNGFADQVGCTNALSINDFPQQPATTMCIGVHFAGRMFRKQCLASTTFGA
jgi:hypothetical protein